jgi:hypothetical protein
MISDAESDDWPDGLAATVVMKLFKEFKPLDLRHWRTVGVQ